MKKTKFDWVILGAIIAILISVGGLFVQIGRFQQKIEDGFVQNEKAHATIDTRLKVQSEKIDKLGMAVVAHTGKPIQ